MTTSQNNANTTAPASKTEQVLAMLTREQGATLAEITELTGWLPHSARAALTGLRKKGHDITRTKRDEMTCYYIAEQA
ncbi:DUF3489 domain-containing protein [Croceicoccus ponticola]|uniref:DUF3489 domain-containing protein n=1 Tax=Croceicoccus ponticola TaxID=2217664 RepID=A0A437GZ38_9SPHN|nr:DUF3489 domain-containing protein [Croceicoccus ponticola]RVQ67535.1 DUF3489 domain-containing protein [Croceicoccus ponticola]